MQSNFFEYNISSILPSYPIDNKTIINTINPHSFCVAKKDAEFKKALQQSDVLLPDGIGIVLAIKLFNNKKISRITGSDIHKHLLIIAEKHKLKVFYLGSSDEVLNDIKNKIKKIYPSINVSVYSPPYKAVFNKEDNQLMKDAVNNFKPDILFIGMTAPKQEKWVFEFKTELSANVIVSIGAVFDFFTENVKRAPKLMRILGLEWLYRLIREPKRMWRRYIVNNFIFIYYVLQEKWFKT